VNGEYNTRLTVYTEFGCSNSTTAFVYANPKAVPAYRSDKTSGCPPLCVNFQDMSTLSSGTFSTSWNFGDLSPVSGNRNPNHCFNAGVYDLRLEVVTDSGCTSVLEHPQAFTVYDNPIGGFNIIPDEVDEDEPNIVVESAAENAVQTRYFINDGSSYNTADFAHNLKNLDGKTNPMIVQIVKNEAGCTDTVYNFVRIKPAFALYVPDAFTPNRDGLNDEFYAKGVGIVEFEMRIYDRWGHLVFSTDKITQGWDGHKNSSAEPVKQDVYTWKATVLDIHKKTHNLVGHVSLIK
jgi:gliding motility-associated-like protein